MAAVCFMVPPVTPSLDQEFSQLLEQVSDREDAELSLNDWGTLYRCAGLKKQGLLKPALTAGVLLAGQDTDPLLEFFCKPQEARTVIMPDEARRTAKAVWKPPAGPLKAHWGTPSILQILPFLKEMGVSRIELCAQPLPFHVNSMSPDPDPAEDGSQVFCGMPVTLIRQSLLSVIPCTGDCGKCRRSRESLCGALRGHETIKGTANLVMCETQTEQPAWADRVLSFL